MEIRRTMEKGVDNTGWATFTTVLGMLTASHWLAQFATSILTLVACLVVAHFVKRELNRRWPTTMRKNGGSDG